MISKMYDEETFQALFKDMYTFIILVIIELKLLKVIGKADKLEQFPNCVCSAKFS